MGNGRNSAPITQMHRPNSTKHLESETIVAIIVEEDAPPPKEKMLWTLTQQKYTLLLPIHPIAMGKCTPKKRNRSSWEIISASTIKSVDTALEIAKRNRLLMPTKIKEE